MNNFQNVIDFETPSEQAISLHKAGHVCAALIVGIFPEIIELTDETTITVVAQHQIPIGNKTQRRLIYSAAYAVEYNLFQSGRLTDSSGNAVSEEAFISLAVGQNASEDKKVFFAENREQANGHWPAEDDKEFVRIGKGVADILDMDCVFALANAMLKERSLDRNRIIEIATPYLPHIHGAKS